MRVCGLSGSETRAPSKHRFPDVLRWFCARSIAFRDGKLSVYSCPSLSVASICMSDSAKVLASRPVTVSARAIVFVGAACLFVLFGMLFGFLVGDQTRKAWLLSFGGAAEFVGILLVASPELELALVRSRGIASRAWERTVDATRRGWYSVLRRLGKGRRTIPLGTAHESEAAVGFGVPKQEDQLQPGEDPVAFLLRRAAHLGRSLEELTGRVEQQRGEWLRDIRERADQQSQEHQRALKDLRWEHFRPRLAGVVLLVIGVLISTFGNLL